jgi:hypothetical protein
MTTYADPTRCPDCSAALGASPRSCPMCGLPLTGPTAFELFAALTNADRALARLRQDRGRVDVPVRGTAIDPLAGATPYPAARRPEHAPRIGLTGISVPRILLSLGALCLLVAAVTFLAVAWSWLGVGGRTVVIVSLTSVALGLGGFFHRRELGMAAEALSIVGLGLVALDVVGARHAGWLGHMGDARLTCVAGSAVAAVSLALLVVTRRRPLVGAAVLAPLAVLAATAGALWSSDTVAPAAVAVVVLIGAARLGRWLPSQELTVSSLAAGALAWAWLVLGGLTDSTAWTVAHLWGAFAVWPLLVAVATMALAAPAVGLGRRALRVTSGIAALLASYAAVLAALDNSQTAATQCLIALTALWAGVLVTVPTRFRTTTAVPLIGALPLPVISLVVLAGGAARAVLGVGEPFSRAFDVHVAPVSPWVAGWLTAPAAVAIAFAGCALAALATPVRRTTWAVALGAAAVAGAALTLPLYDVPLAVVVGVVTLLAAASLAWADRLPTTKAAAARTGGAVLFAIGTLSALPDDLMTALVLLVATAAAALLMTRTDPTAEIASGLFPLAFAGLVWSACEVASVPAVDRAAPVLLILGALSIWRPQVVRETSSAAVSLVLAAASVDAAADTSWALALHLTLAGALVTTTSLVHPSRRSLGWVGGLLLAAASWVRLYDIGVHTPEAYTLPSALVLVALGSWQLRRDPAESTLTMLAPGLGLATVPSLLVALGDPFSLRALLLGGACLALVLVGVAARWNAPLVVGSVVGALLVLRELAPYSATVPPWLLIALSGTLLTVVGVTWESRMRNVRTAAGYVGSLR